TAFVFSPEISPYYSHYMTDQDKYMEALRAVMESYTSISDGSWSLLQSITSFQEIDKGGIVLREGQIARHLHFICKGAMRIYFTDPDGNVYNKNLFMEGNFAASKASLLQNSPSYFTIEALEDSMLINIGYDGYRKLIREKEDIRNFYIAYIEKNWIIEKDQRE